MRENDITQEAGLALHTTRRAGGRIRRNTVDCTLHFLYIREQRGSCTTGYRHYISIGGGIARSTGNRHSDPSHAFRRACCRFRPCHLDSVRE